MNRNRSIAPYGLAGLLLAFALLFAGPALAADGRVLAAAGEVTVDRPEPDGLRSIVAESGFELRAGDTIRTGPDGRAQLRLEDGAIFSLQPRTVFRIDEYRFDTEEQRGFFSLLRGALRTASGQIGKRNHDDYRLQTPTATVGIRGTQYTAEETVCDPGCWPGDRAGLHVAVTEGRIVVTNDFGSLEIGAGEAVRVRPAAAPHRAALPPRLPPREMLAANEDEPGESGAQASPTLVAQAEASDDDPGTAAGLGRNAARAEVVAAESGDAAPILPASKPIRNDPDWNDTRLAEIGAPAAGNTDPDPIVLAGIDRNFDTDFAPNAGRDEDGGLLTLNEDPTIPTPTDPTGSDNGTGEPGTGDPGTGDPGTGDPGTGDPGTGDPGTGDPGTGDPGTGDPGTGDPGTGDPGTGDPGTGDGEIPVDGGTTTGLWRVDVRQASGIGWLAAALGADGRLEFDAERRLTGIGFCPSMACLSSGTTRVAEAGADQWVSWGRWTEGTVVMRAFGLGVGIPYGPNTGMHYLVGSPALTVPTSGEFAYTLAGATAPTMSGGQWAPGTFSGSAAVRFDPGQAARLGLDATVAFSEGSFRIATEGGATNPGASNVRFDSNHAFDATIAASQASGDFCRGSSCTTRISGGLFGPNGERLGVGYTINGANPSTTIDGVGVFTRQ